LSKISINSFSFTELMVYRGIKPGSKLITAEAQQVSSPDSPLLHYLALRPGAKVWHVRRLRLGGKQPLVIANIGCRWRSFRIFLLKTSNGDPFTRS
jgi:DNA-binding GntR family transcriptional regulator